MADRFGAGKLKLDDPKAIVVSKPMAPHIPVETRGEQRAKLRERKHQAKINAFATETADSELDPNDAVRALIATGELDQKGADNFMARYPAIQKRVKIRKRAYEGHVADLPPNEVINALRAIGEIETEEDEMDYLRNRSEFVSDKVLNKQLHDEKTKERREKQVGKIWPGFRHLGVGTKAMLWGARSRIERIGEAIRLDPDTGELGVSPENSLSRQLIKDTELLTAASAVADEKMGLPWLKHLTGAIRSSEEVAIAAATGAGTAGITAWFMGGEANEAITKGRDAGLKGAKLYSYVARAAGIEGLITSTFNRFGMGGLEGMLSKGLPKAARKGFLKNLRRQLKHELSEENLVGVFGKINDKLSSVDTSDWTVREFYELIKDTSIETTMTIGLTESATSLALRSEKIAQRKEAMVNSYKMTPEAVDLAVEKALSAEAGGESFDQALGREIEREAAKTPSGIAKAVIEKEDAVRNIVEKRESGEDISQDDMLKAGFPDIENSDERAEIADDMDIMIEAMDEKTAAIKEEDDGYGPKLDTSEELNIIKEEVPEVITQTLDEIASGREMGSVTDFWDVLGREAKGEIDQWIGLMDEDIGNMPGDEKRFRAMIEKIKNDPAVLENLTEQKPLSRREFKEKMGLDPKKPLPDEFKTQEAREKAIQGLQEPATERDTAKVEKEAPKVVPEETAPTEAPTGSDVAASIMDSDVSLAQRKTVDSVDYQLYREIDGPGGFIRTVDVDTGQTVQIRKYPKFNSAMEDHQKTLDAVEPKKERRREPKAEPIDMFSGPLFEESQKQTKTEKPTVEKPKAPEAPTAPEVTEDTPGAPEANKLYEDNTKMAENIAKKYFKFETPAMGKDDISQEAMVKLREAARDFDPSRGPFAGFAGTLINNHLRDITRKESNLKKKEKLATVDEEGASLIDQIPAPVIEGMSKDAQDAFGEALEALDEKYRDILIRKLAGESGAEIAAGLGVSQQTVSERFNKAKLMVGKALSEANTPAAQDATKIMTRNHFRSEIKEKFGYTDEEADANVALFDALAERLAKDGHIENAEAFYEEFIDAVQRKAGPGRAKINFLENGKAVILAMNNPDVSSLAHEFAHLMRKIASRYYSADMKAIEAWAGVKESKWTRNTEEKFAKAFEKYLREGNAPTKKLQSVFSKFKSWLTDIYKTLVGSQINVRINKNVRSFFDKMLGKEAEAKKARPKKRVRSETFISKKKYPATWQLAHDSALPGKNQARTAGVDLQLLKESAPDLFRALPKDGAGWDMAATSLEAADIGFKIGDKSEAQALFDHLMDEHDPFEKNTGLSGEMDADRADALFASHMQEFEGYTDDELNTLSQDELRDTGKKLGVKVTGLSKNAIIRKIKKRLAKRPKGKAVKAQIRKATGQVKARPKIEVTNEQIFKLEEMAAKKGWKAGKKEMQAFKKSLFDYAKDNLPAGVREKAMTAIKNATTYNAFKKALDRIDVIAAQKEHKDAVDKVKKAIDKANKFTSGGDKFKKMFPHLRDEMSALLGDVDVKKRGKGLKNVIDYLQDEDNNIATPPDIVKYVEDGVRLMGTRNINNMTIEELQQLTDSINYLLHAQKGMAENIQMEKAGKFVNVKDAFLRVIGRPKKEASGRRIIKDTGVLGKIWNRVGYDLEVYTVRFDQGDNGPIQQFIADQVYDSREEASKSTKSFWGAFNKRSAQVDITAAWSHHVAGKTETETFNFGEGKQAVKFTKAQKIYVYLLGQDVEGREALLTSDGFVYFDQSRRGKVINRKGKKDIRDVSFSEENLVQIEESMSKDELIVAKAIQETINKEISDSLNEATLERYSFEKALKENYMKIFRYIDDIKKGTVADQLGEQMAYDPLENAGFMKERTGSKAKLVIPDVFQVFSNHVDEAATYSAYLTPLHNIYAIINDKEIRGAIGAEHGEDALHVFEQRLDMVRGKMQRNPDEKLFAKMRGNFAVNTLWLRPSTFVAQTLSYPSLATELGEASLLKALVYRAAHPKKAQAIIDKIVNATEMFPNRFGDMAFDRDIGARHSKVDLTHMLTGKKRFRNIQGRGLGAFDEATVGTGILAAHFKNEADGGTFESSVDLSKKAVRRTQPMFDEETRTWLGGNKAEMWKNLTMFRSYRDKALTNMTLQYHKKGTVKSKEFARGLGHVLILGAITNMTRLGIWNLLRGKGKDDEEPKEKAKRYAEDFILQMAGYVPLMGEALNVAFKRYRYNQNINAPVFETASELLTAGVALGKSFIAFAKDEEYSRRTGKHMKGDSKGWAKLIEAIDRGLKGSKVFSFGAIEGVYQLGKDTKNMVKSAIGKERAEYMMSSGKDRKYLYEKALEKAKWNDGPLSYQDKLTAKQKKQYDMAKQNHAGKKIKILTDGEPVLDREYRNEWGSKAEEKFEESKARWEKSREKALEELSGFSNNDMAEAFKEYWTREKEDGGLGNKRLEAYHKRLRRLRKFIKENK